MLNKTQRKLADATALGRSFVRFGFILVVLLAGGYLVYRTVVGLRETAGRKIVTPLSTITVEVADTDEKRSRGLSGRKSLAGGKGMLFVFESASKNNCFWMKDTLIPLDFIWLDDIKRVVTVKKNVTPDTYPESFCPDKPSLYGLEVNAGKADELGLQVGSLVSF